MSNNSSGVNCLRRRNPFSIIQTSWVKGPEASQG